MNQSRKKSGSPEDALFQPGEVVLLTGHGYDGVQWIVVRAYRTTTGVKYELRGIGIKVFGVSESALAKKQ
jgi:hypothetical protein